MSDNTQMVALADIERMAAAVAKSKLFGCKTPDEAMALMLVAQAEGMHPMAAVQEFHIIQGRPSRKAEAMLARFHRAGGSVEWHTYTDQEVSGTFSHPQGGSVRVTWNMARAKQAGLGERDNYKSYPAPMFRSRCISEGVRTVYPGATGGMYTPEEIEELPPKDMGAAEIASPQAKSEQTKPVAMDAEIIPAKAAKVAPSKPVVEAESTQAQQPISEGAVRLLLAKLTAAALTDADLCKHFGIEKLTLLKTGQMNDALAYIQNPNGAA